MSDDFDLMREIRRGGSAYIDSSGNVAFTRGPLHWTDQMRDDRAKLIAYAWHCESEIRRLAEMLEETHDQFIDESHAAIHEARHQYGVAAMLAARDQGGKQP